MSLFLACAIQASVFLVWFRVRLLVSVCLVSVCLVSVSLVSVSLVSVSVSSVSRCQVSVSSKCFKYVFEARVIVSSNYFK